ncbi:IS110 family transposase [Chryseobacterium sp. Ch-15]|uniref:IS110 family transposase n=1 Tax=Chryseobacterium muglaense TaxID=2893752 RepID=A0A9Q3YQP3_9FLAO|nr:IS110 family transposase [Chryseobacterium muglaense]MBD3904179.1 IS110 family transposase [Chryseobacterium muglaense]MCC9033248.1 IS110 family transposase [Chryseobacterium muglaense]MCM2553743.1 IS110 family transposase [Chryseobacterium muglaense]
MCKFIGIDISKQTFDVSFSESKIWKHHIFENKLSGFRKLLKLIKSEDWVVMEASGSYYLPLAEFLDKTGINVCVVNPLVIKRFSQTNLYRAKTDKKDAQTIAEYSEKYELRKWNRASENANKLRQLYSRKEMLLKQVHQSKRQLEAFTSSGFLDKFLKMEINNSIKYLENKILKLEKEMDRLSLEEYSETMENLQSIPGVGKQTAMMMCLITDNFEKFDHYKQLIAFVGFSPRIYQSGTSVRGRGHICKMGKAQVRKLLYLCSWSAKRWNVKCKEMYERLKAKGKPERVIKIAIANKLIKQIFAIGKSKEKYKADFC